MAFLRTVVWFFYFFGKLIAMLPQMYAARRHRAQGNEARAQVLVNQCVTRWAQGLLRIAGVTATVTGLENIPRDRAVVFTPNHQGNYDIPLLLVYLDAPHALVAKKETDRIPLVRDWMRLLDCVFIDRQNTRRAAEAMNEAGALLSGGKSVIVFPEGTRSRGDAMGEFKQGAFHIAGKVGAPVVPVAIDGSYRAMEANHGLMCPAHVRITVLPPVETAGMDRAARRALPGIVAGQIAAAKATRRD